MKKKIAILGCTFALMAACSVIAFAEETGTDTGALWDLWSLLNPENVDYVRVISILVTSLVTIVRMFAGSGLKDLGSMLLNALKNLIPSSK